MIDENEQIALRREYFQANRDRDKDEKPARRHGSS
jgi:hypothetical protein